MKLPSHGFSRVFAASAAVHMPLALLFGACGAATDTSEIGLDTQAVRNGSVVTPWSDPSVPVSRAIVSVNGDGCTGTLIDRHWVLTAKHCDIRPGASIVNKRPNNGSVQRTVDFVYGEPGSPGGSRDGVLVHLDRPIDDVPVVPMHWGSRNELFGKPMTCFGYGASVAALCPGDPNNVCLSGADGSLRQGTYMTSDGAIPSEPGLLTGTPIGNPGQSGLPGDSGGPCFIDGKLAAINSGWTWRKNQDGTVSYWSTHTAVESFRGLVMTTIPVL